LIVLKNKERIIIMKEVYFTKVLKERYPEFRTVYGILKDIEMFNLNLNDYLENRKKKVETFIRKNLSSFLYFYFI